MSAEVKFVLDGQWYYRGNLSSTWVALASRPDGSACFIAERLPESIWPALEAIAKARAVLAKET